MTLTPTTASGHTINLNGGELDVTNAADTVPWSILGIVNAGGAASSVIDGDELYTSGYLNVNVNSTLNINTDGVTFEFTDIAVAAGGDFNVNTTVAVGGLLRDCHRRWPFPARNCDHRC